MNCPKCNSVITNDKINIQSDIAQCSNCANIFKISETIIASDDRFDINAVPSGAWIKKDYDSIIIGATTRSPIAFFLVPFMLVWSGGSIGGIYGNQIFRGEFDPLMSLFGIPFLIGSIIFWGCAFMAIGGKVELTLDKIGGEVFTGFGKIGFRKEFEWAEISTIREVQSNLRYPGGQGNTIVLEGKKRLSFGSGLKGNRLYFILKSLQLYYSSFKLNKW